MAIFTPLDNSNGDSDTAATWATVSSPFTPKATDTSNLQSGNEGFMEFTAPNTSTDSLGCIIPLESDGSANSIEVELQEYDGATWTTKATGSTDLGAYTPSGANLDNGWFRIDWGTPYTYTTTTTNYYRIKVWGGGGGYIRLWQQSTGSGYDCWLYVIDDRTGVPGDGDQVYAIGSAEVELSFKIVGTSTVGAFSSSVSELGIATPYNNYTSGIILGHNCTMNIDTTSDVDLTVKGYFTHIFGKIIYGEESTQPTNNLTLRFDTNSTNGGYGYWNAASGTINLWGNSEKVTRMFYSDGDGSTGDPLEVDSTWEVGDKIVLASGTSGQYNDFETKYIKTKPTSTTATLSDTDGGAESASSYTFDSTATMTNFTRKLVITTVGGYNLDFAANGNPSLTNTSDTSMIRGAEFQNVGNSGVRVGLYFGDTNGNATRLTLQKCSVYEGSIYCRSRYQFDIDDLVTHYTSTQLNISGRGSNVTNMWASDSLSARPLLISGANHTVNGFVARCCDRNNSSAGGAIWISEANRPQLRNLDIKTTRRRSIYIAGSSGNIRIFNSDIGGEQNSIEINSGIYTTMYFESTTLSAPTPVDGLSSAGDGTELYFDRYSDTVNDHRLYVPTGTRTTTGSGLSDTVTRTAGNLSIKYEPTDATIGMSEEFLILSNPNSTATVNFYARRSSGLTAAKFELFLRGSATADATVEWDNTVTADEWRVVSLAADWANSIPRYATIRVTALGTTGSLRIADIYNGENNITGLNTYFEGKIGPVMFPQIADVGAISSAVWSDSETYSAGQKGQVLQDGADSAELASIK